jgi:hypothetical protein
MSTDRKRAAILAAIIILGFAIRYMVWIYPMYATQGIIIYDTGTYTVFGLAYIEALTSMNLTALAGINVGVPPLAMLLTGLTTQAFGQYIGPIQASLVAPMTASALTAIPAYMIARKISPKLSLIPPALVAFDPFLIQFSASYLDSIGTLFALTSTAYTLNTGDRKSTILAILFASLAVLTKLSFAIFITIYAILRIIFKQTSIRSGVSYILIPSASLALSPWLWMPSGLQTSVTGHLQFNNLPLSPFIGPFVIGLPQSLPWYILAYLGMGQVAWNTLPPIAPLVLLAIIMYTTMKNKPYITGHPAAMAASAMMLTIFLLPRNYWTYSWGGGAIQGVLIRQFYPYYFYPLIPFLATLIPPANRSESINSRLVTYPILLTTLLSPLTFTMNLGLPYWDFLFTLIYSSSQGSWVAEGIIAITITVAILIASVTAAELLHRKGKANGQSGGRGAELIVNQ